MRRELLIALGFALAMPVLQARADSVAYQIDAAHDGHASFPDGFSAPLKLKWTRNLEGSVSYPLIAKGIVFVTVDGPKKGESQLTALSLQTGETLWQQTIAGGLVTASNLAYDNGRVFVLNSGGMLWAFAADNTGRLLWTSHTLPGAFTPPVAANGLVYVNAGDSGIVLFAIDEQTGKIIWQKSDGYGSNSEPVLGEDGVYEAYVCSYRKYDAAKGKLIWRDQLPCSGGGIDYPVYYGNRLYFHSGGPLNAVILNATSGKITGSLSSGTAVIWQSSTSPEYRVLTYDDGALISFSPGNGNIDWRFKGSGNFPVAPIVINDLVAVASNAGKKGKLVLLDAKTGKPVWSQTLGGPMIEDDFPYSPTPGLAASDGYLLVPSSNLLTAFGQ
ncbi:MAG TPA: PQQ-binding-like beta-propeller repeat protein [Rhizomicrobium sp.]|jgi:outer membrane protein assembly factor BamB